MRTDTYLAENGFFKSRTKAKSAIDEGRVFIDGKAVTRASEEYCGGEITVSGGEKYVSRAGLKLEHALECFGMDVRGAVALDIGASTGGFTDCLLQHGAARVYTLDVGARSSMKASVPTAALSQGRASTPVMRAKAISRRKYRLS